MPKNVINRSRSLPASSPNPEHYLSRSKVRWFYSRNGVLQWCDLTNIRTKKLRTLLRIGAAWWQHLKLGRFRQSGMKWGLLA